MALASRWPALAFFWNLIMHASTAGFGLKDFTWYQYFFTECRAPFRVPGHVPVARRT